MIRRIQKQTGLVLGCVLTLAAAGCGSSSSNNASNDSHPIDPALAMQGKDIFRSDTFGDETLWTDTLMMDKVIPTLSPMAALGLGLKVDMDALPAAVVTGVMNGTISLTDPAVTVTLIKLNAVVGVKGTVDSVGGTDTLTRVGITCALCHSNVDNAFAPGVGHRQDDAEICVRGGGRRTRTARRQASPR